jgi:GNAT superfamily N-acetyltransferase
VIRLATNADVPVLRDCAVAAFARYVPRMGCKPAPMTADIAAAVAAREVHVDTNASGAIAGYAICRALGRDMLLDTVAVWPDAMGQGVGTRLVAHVEGLARHGGYDAVTLYTNAVMTENLGFYAALGYVCTGRAVQDGYDRMFFRKQVG